MNSESHYVQKIKNRSTIKFYLGILPRLKNYLFNQYAVFIAKKKWSNNWKRSCITFKNC